MKEKVFILLLALCIVPFLSAPASAETTNGQTYETGNDMIDTESVSTTDINSITFIYHAGGAIDGRTGSNSLEALEATYAAGGRFIEIDFNWTTDGELACIHDFSAWFSPAFSNGAVSLATFMSTKIFGQYTPMSLKTLTNWVAAHPDVYIITDVKEYPVAALQKIAKDYPTLVANVIPQIYEKDQLDPVRRSGYKHIILTVYTMKVWQDKYDAKMLATFARKNGLFGLTFPVVLTEENNYVATMKTGGVKLFTHTVNDVDEIRAYFKMGIDGIYTDGLFSCPYGEKCSVLTFMDISEKAWYHEAVDYVYNNDLFSGTSATTFDPEMVMSRAMLVTVLYRIDGKPDITAENHFLDVEAGNWYTDAVIWADANEIVYGYDDGNFGPNDSISREQMAVILYRYTEYKGYDMTASADLSGFTDADEITDYAETAMAWAYANHIINGMGDGTLDPQGKATRKQVAAILQRFCELSDK